jgi:hypothetical protein
VSGAIGTPPTAKRLAGRLVVIPGYFRGPVLTSRVWGFSGAINRYLGRSSSVL